MATAVEVSSVRKTYGSINAVDGVSFSVEKGEIFAVLGPNGAGKTTLIEMLEGLRKAEQGTMKVLDLDPWGESDLLHKRVGVVPQSFTFFGKATPKEAVKYYADLFGIDANADDVLREVLLEDAADTLFENLSGGQKQKVGVALSLVNSADLLFLDEPTTGLDPTARRAIWEVIRSLKSKGKTIILTTHYLDEAQQLSDRIAVMNHGQVVVIGTVDEIIAEHGSGERLDIHGSEELALYIKANTDLKVEYDGRGLISIALNHKTDALAALEAVKQSGLDWGDIHTHEDNLEDVFVKLVRGKMDEHGEIMGAHERDNSSGQRRD